MSPALELTDEAYWNRYWRGLSLPAEVKRGQGLYIDAILDRFDRHLPAGSGLRALEVGGAPGQYLAYMHRRFGYAVTCLDYSPEGCLKARENFHLLGIDGEVVVGDLFDRDLVLEPYDVVYSLGLVEHFSDLETVVRHHLRFLRPGGTLLLGAPNLRGLNAFFLNRLAPEVLRHCEADSMDLSHWPRLELALGLEVVYRGYLGGLEPGVFVARRSELRSTFLGRLAEAASLVLHDHVRWLRRINGPALSGYLMGVYRCRDPQGAAPERNLRPLT